MTEHVYSPHVVLVNPAAYDALSDEFKAIFDECMAAATDKQFEYAIAYEQTAVEDCEKGGAKVTALTDEAKAEFQQVLADADINGMVKAKMTHPEYMDQMVEMLA
jgi:TRAP-type C4-dicarboxylate transport system substrate-binding protein